MNKHLASVAVIALCLPSLPALANILTFDGSICSSSTAGTGGSIACTNGAYINQSYGDTATANITYADQVNRTSLQFWTTGYSNLTNVLYGGNGDGAGQSNNLITIAPAAGFTVTLSSFNLGGFLGSYTTNVQILDTVTNAVLYSSLNAQISSGTATLFSPNITSSDAIGIEWYNTGYDVGIDNVTFSTTAIAAAVPEPFSLAIVSSGLIGLRLARRGRKRARV
jgi:hypothetical protein